MTEKSFAELAIKSVLAGKKSFCKFLAANDTGKTGGHQAGIYIPKSAVEIIFNENFPRGENVSRWAKFFGKMKLSLTADLFITVQKLVMNTELQIAATKVLILWTKKTPAHCL